MTIISGYFEKSDQETLIITLNCRDYTRHCTTVQPELYRITTKALFNQLGQVAVSMKEGTVELVQGLSDEGQ